MTAGVSVIRFGFLLIMFLMSLLFGGAYAILAQGVFLSGFGRVLRAFLS
jgi:hypothetical protein